MEIKRGFTNNYFSKILLQGSSKNDEKWFKIDETLFKHKRNCPNHHKK